MFSSMANYKQQKIVDKEVQTNGFERRSEEFQENLTDKGDIYEMIGEITDSATEKEFKKKGIDRVEKYAGVYATGKPYGSGVQEGKYDVRYSSQVKSSLQKQVIYGTKKLQTEITMDFDPEVEMLKLNYDGTEMAVFKGHMNNDDPMGFMINDKITISTKDKKKLKSELDKFFKACATKEVGYIMGTRLGNDDKIETGTAGSLSENKNKIAMNDLLNSSPEDIENFFNSKLQESIDGGMKNFNPEGGEVESDDIADELEGEEVEGPDDYHTQDVIDANSQGSLLFDDDVSEDEIGNYKTVWDSILSNLFPEKEFEELDDEEKSKLFLAAEKVWVTPDEREEMISEGKAVDFGRTGQLRYATYVTLNSERRKVSDALNESLEEMTTAGAGAGSAGGFEYDQPSFFKKGFSDTNYAKNKEKRPSVKKVKNEQGSYDVVVDVDGLGETHPLGLPGVKLGSKEELKLSKRGGGGAAGTKFIKKLQENRTYDSKRYFTNTSENESKGINKRYVIEKELTTEEVENKWARLAGFISESTINKEIVSNEERELYNECGCQDMESEESPTPYTYLNGDVVSREDAESQMNDEYEEENAELDAMANKEDLVDVEKPDSFVILRISKSDLMNENKKFVFDHNTNNFVLHPMHSQTGFISENQERVFDIKSRSYIQNPKFNK